MIILDRMWNLVEKLVLCCDPAMGAKREKLHAEDPVRAKAVSGQEMQQEEGAEQAFRAPRQPS